MKNISYIRLINAHSKCVSCNYDRLSVIYKIFLILFSYLIRQTCMVSRRRNSIIKKHYIYIIHIFTCCTIDYSTVT